MLCASCLSPAQAISNGVLFGLYFHKTSTHAPEENRIVCGYTRLAEQDERMFTDLRQLCRSTTGHPADVALQVTHRYQMKSLCTEPGESFQEEDRHLQQRASQLPTLNTSCRFSAEFVTTHQGLFQQHLERIDDYMLPGSGVWWHYDAEDVVFKDPLLEQSHHLDGPGL